MYIEKRIRFVVSTVSLTLLILLSTFFFFDKAIIFIPILIAASYGACFFSIYEGIEKLEWYMLFVIPVLLSVAMYLFYFLFPVRWLTRIPFITIYSITMYATLLSSNIFNVDTLVFFKGTSSNSIVFQNSMIPLIYLSIFASFLAI